LPGGNRNWEISEKRVPIPKTRIPEALFGNSADALDVYECVLNHDWIYIRLLNAFDQLGIVFYHSAGRIHKVFENISISLLKI
jgi:hypothetical protein